MSREAVHGDPPSCQRLHPHARVSAVSRVGVSSANTSLAPDRLAMAAMFLLRRSTSSTWQRHRSVTPGQKSTNRTLETRAPQEDRSWRGPLERGKICPGPIESKFRNPHRRGLGSAGDIGLKRGQGQFQLVNLVAHGLRLAMRGCGRG